MGTGGVMDELVRILAIVDVFLAIVLMLVYLLDGYMKPQASSEEGAGIPPAGKRRA